MSRIARLLPLVTVAAWVITLVLPILDNPNTRGAGMVVSSLGGSPLSLMEAEPAFLFAWAGVLGCAASAWLFRSLRWWSFVAILVAVLLGVFLVSVLMHPPSLFWDGVDADGRPIGGYEVSRPAAGAVMWIVGIQALLAAGVFGLIGRTRQGNSR